MPAITPVNVFCLMSCLANDSKWLSDCKISTHVLGYKMTTIEKIERQVKENPILLYMKGSPKLPSCGFSAQAVQALSSCGERFAYVDILQNPDIRAELPKYANWPTFPQLWVDGELVGGCDIIVEMFQRGELQALIKETADKYRPADETITE
jgi:monothiol glutaredoxin